jgi:hypothetical protein
MVARTQPEVVVPAMITLSEPSSVRDDLFDKERACQLRPGEPAEVDGTQCTDVASQIRGFVPSVDATGAVAPAARVPTAEFIDHLDDHETSILI